MNSKLASYITNLDPHVVCNDDIDVVCNEDIDVVCNDDIDVEATVLDEWPFSRNWGNATF